MFVCRFLIFEVGFKGFAVEKTVAEHLMGYEVPFFKTIKEQDPALGGDPSQNTILLLCPNYTEGDAPFHPQKMYTGKGDSSKVR